MNNPLSYSSVKIDLLSKDDVHLEQASGFVLEAGDQHYLITNRHVVCGTDMQGPVFAARTLKTILHVCTGQDERANPLHQGMRKRIAIQLYDNDDVPRWLECRVNEQYQPIVDIIALPLQLDLAFENELTKTLTAKNYWLKLSSIPISAIDAEAEYAPPDTVQIIGYPRNWTPCGTDQYSTAFWRTSSIASEIDELGRMHSDVFFVDPSAPEGMTGAPVVGMKDNRVKLIGVYSDVSTDEFGANAGFVWNASLLKELLDAF